MLPPGVSNLRTVTQQGTYPVAASSLFRRTPVKIICLEEHAMDAALARATQPSQMQEAPYMAALVKGTQDQPSQYHDDRPHLAPMKLIMERAADLGDGRIAQMDQHGIDMQVLSYSNPTQLAPPHQAVDLARAANDRLANAVAAHPSRLRAFATLPWQLPEAAAAELERTVTQLGMVGTLLIGRPGETFLDDKRYEPVLAKLNELKVPVYVHPGTPLPQVQGPYYGGFTDDITARLSLFAWGWHNESGVQVVRMLLAGLFDRYPDLQVISGHWGEMVPFFLQRLDDSLPQEVTGLSRSLTDTYKAHVYVTPSGMLYPLHFDFVTRLLGPDRVLYSVDYPYLTLTGARHVLENLPLDQQDKDRIAHGNAEALLRLH